MTNLLGGRRFILTIWIFIRPTATRRALTDSTKRRSRPARQFASTRTTHEVVRWNKDDDVLPPKVADDAYKEN